MSHGFFQNGNLSDKAKSCPKAKLDGKPALAARLGELAEQLSHFVVERRRRNLMRNGVAVVERDF